MKLFRPLLCIVLLFFCSTLQIANAQDTDCGITQPNNNGYSTTLSSVTLNDNGTHTIVLTVANDGCQGCKKLKYFWVQALPGTYSGIAVASVQGNVTITNINPGPGYGPPFQGFRINIADGIGGGNAAAFTITYTLTGGLQNQQLLSQAGTFFQYYNFLITDFQAVLDCQTPVGNPFIVPYYDPLGVGKVFDIIGYELRSLYFSYQEVDFVAEEVDDIFQIVGETVLISLLAQPGELLNAQALLETQAYGLTGTVSDPVNNTMTGLYPINNLLLINDLPELFISAAPVFPALTNAGLVTSQGDIALRSFRARDVFKVDGAGTKVGVISDSYNTKLGDQASDDIIKGDLPGPANPANTQAVDVLQEFPFGEASDEGRAMLQIVHDVAPGASLAFRTGFAGPNDFAVGINALAQAGCDVIVDDVTYINEPFFRDGVIAQAVNNVASEGVAYFTAAGNFGSKSWADEFNPVPAPAGIIGEAHNFSNGPGTDVSQNVTLAAGQYTVVLQWDDGTPGLTTQSDFDIYLATDANIAFFGFNHANIGSTPIEVLPFTVLADGVQTNFQIIRAGVAPGYVPTQPTALKYIVYRGSLTINEYAALDASTITGQANAEGAMSVGAVLYTNTPEYGVPAPTVASFSSRGGTPVNGNLRPKPDFCAPNVVNTTVDLGGGIDFEGDGFPNFVGTSAAAPHAAAMAALMLEARQKYYDDEGGLLPSTLRNLLQSSALDMYSPGYDVESGAGFLLADSALGKLANPSAYLLFAEYDTTLIPGIDEIPVTIYGEYLNSNSVVFFNGTPLETESFLQGDTAIVVIIPTYQDILFPEIQVYNPPMEGTNGLDGGLSNTIYLTTKTLIFVDIQDTIKTFGETIPQFSANYFLGTVDGNAPIESADLSAEEMSRVMGIGITTIANSLSNVGLWGIEPDPINPLNPLSGVEATDSLDISLLQRFNFVFSNGLMTVVPLDIIVDARDTTLLYNDSLVGFSFDYLFNLTDSLNIDPGAALAISEFAITNHSLSLSTKRAALVQGTALVNELGEQLLSESVLTNVSIMISTGLKITQGVALVNGTLLDPEALFETASIASAPRRLVQGVALVNGQKLVQGTALVNELDESGNITNAYPLTQGTALVNSGSAQLNTTTFNANSNAQTIVILGLDDIEILTGEAEGNVETEPINLVTGQTVGSHIIVPGAFISNNFNVSYRLGTVTIVPDTASFAIDVLGLEQVYDGSPKVVNVTAVPDSVSFIVTYNGSEAAPTNAGVYNVEVQVTDTNYVGSAFATLTILQATAAVTIDPASLIQVYDGSPKTAVIETLPSGLSLTVTYDGEAQLPVNVGSYAVLVVVNDMNYVGSASAILTIEPAPLLINCPADISVDCNSSLEPMVTGMATASDICGTATITYTDGAISGACNQTLLRTWTATDACGSSSSCIQTITIADTTAPTLIMPSATSATTTCTQLSITDAIAFSQGINQNSFQQAAIGLFNIFGLVPIGTEDDCNDSEWMATGLVVTLGTCPVKVTLTRSFVAVDACGNVSAEQFTQLNIIDQSSPQIFCPADIVVACGSDISPSVTGTATATDNCSGPLSISYYDTDFTGFCPTSFVRVWVAEDGCGNSATCEQFITLLEDDNCAAAPNGLAATLTAPNTVLFSWNPVPGSIGCRVFARPLGSSTTITAGTVVGNAPSQLLTQSNLVQNGLTIQWRVICACSTNPLLATPYSPWNTFTYNWNSNKSLASNADNIGNSGINLESGRVYPNPTQSSAFLNAKMSEGDVVMVRDISGMTVASTVAAAEGDVLEIDMKRLSAGVYFIEHIDRSGIPRVYKVIKN